MSRRGGQRARYRQTQRLVVAGAVAYLALVVYERGLHGRAPFPVSSWSLFSTVPNHVDDYAVRVRAIGGTPLKGGAWFEQSPALFRFATDHQAHMMIYALGRALNAVPAGGPTGSADKIRRAVERTFLMPERDGPVEYDVVARRYDPMERWRSDAILSERTLGHFIISRAQGVPDPSTDALLVRADPAQPPTEAIAPAGASNIAGTRQ